MKSVSRVATTEFSQRSNDSETCTLLLDSKEYLCHIGSIDRNGAYLRDTTPIIPKNVLNKFATIRLQSAGSAGQRECRVVYNGGIPHMDGIAVCFDSAQDQRQASSF